MLSRYLGTVKYLTCLGKDTCTDHSGASLPMLNMECSTTCYGQTGMFIVIVIKCNILITYSFPK